MQWLRRAWQARQKPKGWLTPEEDALVPPRSLWIGPDDPISHYYRWPWEYLAYLTLLANVKRTSCVLELGCGHGRTARGLLDYLRAPGRYVGLDVDARRIRDAQERIQRRVPNFEFVWADVYNRQYNPRGREAAAKYRFPVEDQSFDTVYAASLLTHLLPGEVQHYFAECRRVLKSGGTCLFSAFVLDHYRGPGSTLTPMCEFDHPLLGHPGVAARDPKRPDVAIAYALSSLRQFANDASLELVLEIPGLWSDATEWAVNEHDLILLQRQA